MLSRGFRGSFWPHTAMQATCLSLCTLILASHICVDAQHQQAIHAGTQQLGRHPPLQSAAPSPWWHRWLDWWHSTEPDRDAPGHLWDAYLPRTTPAEARALAQAAAELDARKPDVMANAADQAEDDDDWIVPGEEPESVPWTARNSSKLVPTLNKELMWLLKLAEDRLSNASGVPFSLKTARRLAMYNSVAYCLHENIAHWNCTRCHGMVESMEVDRTIYDEGWDLFGYTGYSAVMNAIIVAFKGTDSHSIYNWAENMHYWKTDYQVPFPGSEGAAVHTGFFISYNGSQLQPNVTESVGKLLKRHPTASLYVIGHSMGAAMAHVCILDMKFKYSLPKDRLFLYTFGSPRIGNDIFAKFLQDQVQVSIRVTHNRDIVPSVPPMWVGFHHVATEVWQVDFDVAHVLGICNGSGEDPLCHNSVCFLGLCTSVADHLHYLGAKMYHRAEAPC